jgi:hypothetical protein
MNTLQKFGSACLLLCALILGLWFSKGMHLATPQQIEKIEVTTDDFGDEVKTSVWVDNPDSLDIGLDLAGPAIAIFGALGLGLFWRGRKA